MGQDKGTVPDGMWITQCKDSAFLHLTEIPFFGVEF